MMRREAHNSIALPTVEELVDGTEGTGGIYGEVLDLRHQLHFLTIALEHLLGRHNGKGDGHHVTIAIALDHADAITWLASEAQGKVMKLARQLEAVQQLIDQAGA